MGSGLFSFYYSVLAAAVTSANVSGELSRFRAADFPVNKPSERERVIKMRERTRSRWIPFIETLHEDDAVHQASFARADGKRKLLRLPTDPKSSWIRLPVRRERIGKDGENLRTRHLWVPARCDARVSSNYRNLPSSLSLSLSCSLFLCLAVFARNNRDCRDSYAELNGEFESWKNAGRAFV